MSFIIKAYTPLNDVVIIPSTVIAVPIDVANASLTLIPVPVLPELGCPLTTLLLLLLPKSL